MFKIVFESDAMSHNEFYLFTSMFVFLPISYLFRSVILIGDKINQGVEKSVSEEEKQLKPEIIISFKPFKTHIVTTTIMLINILVFVLMRISGVRFIEPEIQSLIDWGGNLRSLVQNGDYWRLLTNIFVHIGFWHLILNLYAFYFIGLILEAHIGSIRFVLVYLISGILASVASIWWQVDVLSAGASGAIFGLYGFFAAMLLFKAVDTLIVSAFMQSILAFVGISLLMGFGSGVDNAAHIGGLLTGFVLGLSQIPSKAKHWWQKWK